eukprot:TRINITY_DN7363_c0_g1_i1.p1 TRINITY_DN7363_c0_g1~~TRINITY_DN7363_c0_g1_i1.p1  ORF type:complete len:850 (+),score=186.16 TRINITY_DN7363_c0_g1_i1:40-2589(+)
MAAFRPERRDPGDSNMKGITQEEVSKLTKAMKQKEFRDHIDEYTREISDPAHRQEYLDYLAQVEAKGEMPEGQQLLRCQPGMCVKTNVLFKNGQKQKCFINIVHSDRLDDLSITSAEKGEGSQVYLPYSLSPPRPDRDQKDEYCMTCDFAVSTGTFIRAKQSSQILKMLIDTAADGMVSRFLKGHEEVSKDFKVMQRMACKGGIPMPMSVQGELLKDKGKNYQPPKVAAGKDAITPAELKEMRKSAKQQKKMSGVPDPNDDEPEEAQPVKVQEPVPGRIRVPQHRLIHSGTMDLTDYMEVSGRQNPNTVCTIPRMLRLVVELPTVKKASDVNMEVTNNNVMIEVEGKYYLDLPLPYEIDDSSGGAKFDKAKQTLTLELPVVPKMPDPEAVALASRLQGLGSLTDERDGALSEGGGSEELDPLQEETLEEDKHKKNGDASNDEEAASSKGKSPEATQPEQKKREVLELDPRGSSLRVASAPENATVVEGETALLGVEEHFDDDLDDAGTADKANFIPAEKFEGARRGYFFGTGLDGLGYYRDRRQPTTRRQAKQTPLPAHTAEPLVVEVVEEKMQPKQLPEYAELYLKTTASLSSRLASSEADVVATEVASLDSSLGRQNLLLRIGIPPEDGEVADLRLSLVGRRLTLSFCSRPYASQSPSSSSSPSRWRRHCLRRTLCGAVDLRQWHAELGPAAGAGKLTSSVRGKELHVVLRKAIKGEVWEAAFINDGSSRSVTSDVLPSATATVAQAHDAEAVALGLAPEPEEQRIDDNQAGPERAHASAATVPIVEDSAELDIDDPVVQETSRPEGPLAAPSRSSISPESTAAMVQSATVMGQSVLLRNRLMYQLL